MIAQSIINSSFLKSLLCACLPACGINGLVANFFPLLVWKQVEWSEKISDKAIFIWHRLSGTDKPAGEFWDSLRQAKRRTQDDFRGLTQKYYLPLYR